MRLRLHHRLPPLVAAAFLSILPTGRAAVMYSVQDLGTKPDISSGPRDLVNLDILQVSESGTVSYVPLAQTSFFRGALPAGMMSLGYDFGMRSSEDGQYLASTAQGSTPPLWWQGLIVHDGQANRVDLGSAVGSAAYDVNNSGQAVGFLTYEAPGSYNSTMAAALFSPTGGAINLGTLGGTSAQALGISNSGLIVGTSSAAGGDHAFLYQNGSMIDLNNLIPSSTGIVLTSADSVNDAGQIAVWGKDRTGVYHELLLSPTTTPYDPSTGTTPPPTPPPTSAPEPSTVLVFGLVGGVAALWHRRRREAPRG